MVASIVRQSPMPILRQISVKAGRPGVEMWKLREGICMTTLTALCTGIVFDGTITIVPARSHEWQFGWGVYRRMLSPGAWIRSNEALQGWLAAREDHRAADVDGRDA